MTFEPGALHISCTVRSATICGSKLLNDPLLVVRVDSEGKFLLFLVVSEEIVVVVWGKSESISAPALFNGAKRKFNTFVQNIV